MVCKNFDELEKVLKDKIETAMLTEVSDVVEEAIIDHVQTDVYDVYDPVEYQRRYGNGGLGDKANLFTSIETKGNTIEMQTDNLTKGSQYHRVGNNWVTSKNANDFLTRIVELGVDYEHSFRKDNAKPPFLSANGLSRPFMKNTVEQLQEDKWHVGALQVGLVKQGIEVKRNG